MKRSINDLSADELKAILNDTSTADDIEGTDVVDFVNAMRFKPGNVRVPFSLILAMYRLWTKKPTRAATLARTLADRFKRARSRYEVFYMLYAPYLV